MSVLCSGCIPGCLPALVSDEEAGQFRRTRPVRISERLCAPRDVYEIRSAKEVILPQAELENFWNVLCISTVTLHVIQPFIDCNKRTACLVESIVMMNAD